MSEINSQKMIGLEQENKVIADEATDLRVKTQKYLIDIEVKDEKYNKLKYAYE